jgi:hypothetical protein
LLSEYRAPGIVLLQRAALQCGNQEIEETKILKVEKYCFLRLPNARCKTFSFDHYFQITIRLKTNNCFATNMAEGTISMRKWKEKKSLHSEERNEE